MAENGGAKEQQAPSSTPEMIQAKAAHQQALARIDREHERQMAELQHQQQIELSRGFSSLPFSLRIYFDPGTFRQMESIANMLANSGSVAKHLKNNPGACMDCVDRAIAWKQSPWFVARNQYRVHETTGYYGALIIAALNASGFFAEPLEFEHFAEGDAANWNNVLNKFEMRQSKRTDADGKPLEYAVPTYTDRDEMGLGVIVRGIIASTGRPREFKFYLRQARPRNSVLWATDPMTQICYTAARRFGNIVCPHVLGGILLDDEIGMPEPEMRDITPPREAAPPLAEGLTPREQPAQAQPAQAKEDAPKADDPPKRRGRPPAAEQSDGKPLIHVPGRAQPYKNGKNALDYLAELIKNPPGRDQMSDDEFRGCEDAFRVLRVDYGYGKEIDDLEAAYNALWNEADDDQDEAPEPREAAPPQEARDQDGEEGSAADDTPKNLFGRE